MFVFGVETGGIHINTLPYYLTLSRHHRIEHVLFELHRLVCFLQKHVPLQIRAWYVTRQIWGRGLTVKIQLHAEWEVIPIKQNNDPLKTVIIWWMPSFSHEKQTLVYAKVIGKGRRGSRCPQMRKREVSSPSKPCGLIANLVKNTKVQCFDHCLSYRVDAIFIHKYLIF